MNQVQRKNCGPLRNNWYDSSYPVVYMERSSHSIVQKQLKLSGEDMPRDDKVAILKDSLAAIGRRIELVLNAKEAAGEDRDRWRRHLWT